jgi:UDP-N-acetylmuramoylalanine--D-glutamate ligase
MSGPDRPIAVTTFAGRTVAVFGLARSGLATAAALRAGGADVACWDDAASGREAALAAGLPLVDLTMLDWSGIAALVLAPGVPLTHPKPHWTVERATAAGVPVIGDVEVFFRARAATCPDAPVIAITGTNGKSTTTALVAHLLRHLGLDVAMGGNIGVGVLALPPPGRGRVHVLEVSSFQIDLTPTLDPTVGVLLNVTPDHLDRHGTMERYAQIKARLPRGAQRAVICVDDAITHRAAEALAADGRSPMVTTTMDTPFPRPRWRARDGQLWAPASAEPVADLAGILSLRGTHNAENALAAVAALHALGEVRPDLAVWRPNDIRAGLRTFPGLAHRMEDLGRIGAVGVVNDSKATNAVSTAKALAAFERDIHWILGGVAKEGGIEPLRGFFPRIAHAYLIGASTAAFAATLEGAVATTACGTLDAALERALSNASASGAREPVVLLSPACASYDQFKSFEHRGDHFRALVEAHRRAKTA